MYHQKISSGSDTCDKSSQSRLIPYRHLAGLHGFVLGAAPIFLLFSTHMKKTNRILYMQLLEGCLCVLKSLAQPLCFSHVLKGYFSPMKGVGCTL